MTRPTKPVPMCSVSIDHQDYLLPFSLGVKLVELMQHAVRCRLDYAAGFSARAYVVSEQPTVEFCAVKPNQIVMPSGPLRLPNRSET